LQREAKPKTEDAKTAELSQLAALIAQHKAQILEAWGAKSSGQRITEEQIDLVIAGLRTTAVSNNPKAQEDVLREIKAGQSSQAADQAAAPGAAELQRSPIPGGSGLHGLLQRGGGNGGDPEPIVPVWVDRLFALLVLILMLYMFFAGRQRAIRDAEEADGEAEDAEALAAAAPAGQGARRRRNGGGAAAAAPPAAADHPAPAAADHPAPAADAPAPAPVVYNVGKEIELEDAADAQAALDEENQANAEAYDAARQAEDQYQQQRRAYNHDRDEAYVPGNGGASVQINVDDGSRQAYHNIQGYFPAAGAPYQEYNINPHGGGAGNYRKIVPAQAVNNFSYWVGWNMTHPGGHWIRGWNTALNRWQVWNEANHTGADLPGHVAAAPVAPPADQRQLARDGYTEKSLQLVGPAIRVVGTPKP
jgi:hypothetical protein